MNRWLVGARPRTLAAALVPVMVGTAAAAGLNQPGTGWAKGIIWWRAGCALVVAVAVQVATNYANDYSDGIRGVDSEDRIGPARLVGSGLATAAEVKRAMIAAFAVTLVAGTPLVLAVGWELVAVGVAAVAAGWFYTGGSRPYGYAGYGEVFVFVFFGLVATVGSTYVQVETVTALSLLCAVAVGSLSTALLVVNNLRDIPGDSRCGKRTLAVRMGENRTRIVYTGLMVVPYLLLPLIAGVYARPVAAAAFVVILPARRPVLRVLEGAVGPDLIPVLGQTGLVQLAFGVTLATGLWLSAP